MSIISEIKCAKCDRMYSGIRSKCPYCNARRIGFGKYSEDSANARGKLLIAVLIMSVFVVATGVLLFTTEPEDLPDIDIDLSNAGDEPLDGDTSPDDHVSLPSANPVITDPDDDLLPPDDPTPVGPIRATSISVRYNNSPLISGSEGREFSFSVGDALTLTVRIEPLGVEDEIIWSSSDRAIFEVTPTNPEHTEVTVRAIGRGTGRLTVTVGDISETVIVRVPS